MIGIANRWPVPSQYLSLIVLFHLLFSSSFSHKKNGVPPKSILSTTNWWKTRLDKQGERVFVCVYAWVCVFVQSCNWKEKLLIYKNFRCELSIFLISFSLSRALLLMISTPLSQKVIFFSVFSCLTESVFSCLTEESVSILG